MKREVLYPHIWRRMSETGFGISSTFAGLINRTWSQGFQFTCTKQKVTHSLTRYIELAENHKRNCVSPIKTYHLSNVKKKKKIVLFVVSYCNYSFFIFKICHGHTKYRVIHDIWTVEWASEKVSNTLCLVHVIGQGHTSMDPYQGQFLASLHFLFHLYQ